MAKNKKPAEQDDDEKDLEDDEEEAEEEESEDEDESKSKEESEDEEEDESDDEDDSKHLDDEEDEDEDLDAELDRERAEDKKKKEAREGFLKRKGKKEEKTEEEGDKPLTRREIDSILADDRKARQEMDALTIAKSLTKSVKAAELIVAKWKNRQFPTHLTLNEQVMEMYGAVYANRLVGEKNEALRALRNKGRVNKDGSGTHHDAKSKKPKVAPSDMEAMKGWEWKEGKWEKKLKSGNKLVRDPKTKRTTLVRTQ